MASVTPQDYARLAVGKAALGLTLTSLWMLLLGSVLFGVVPVAPPTRIFATRAATLEAQA